jgi:predicted dehydrogenase/threonine dehydrogenase-like Zn-dependent dehydrogenase
MTGFEVSDLKQVLIRRGCPVVADVPAPQVTDHTILVEVRYSLISTGTEVAGLAASDKSMLRQALEDPRKVLRGLEMLKDTGFRRTMAVVDGAMEGAYPTGYSCSGVVVASGRSVAGFAAGQRVACAGAGKANHAEIVAVPQNLAVLVPDECDLQTAASATVGAIAMQGIRRADVRLGEVVVVVGLGLIGQITVQLLRAAGCRIIGTDLEESKLSMAKTFGMSAGFLPGDGDPIRQVLNFTGGSGADVVIITASAQSGSVLQQATQMVRRKGRVVVVGAVPLQMERSPLYEKEADVLISCSYGPGRYDPEYEDRGLDYPFAYVRWTENRNMAEYLRLASEGFINIKPLIGEPWAFADAPQAYADLRQNKRVAALLSHAEGSVDEKRTSRIAITNGRPDVSGRIRVGIIGAGSFAQAVHLPNLQQLSDDFSISAIASRTGSTAWNVARQYGARYASTAPEDLFNDPDLDLILISSRHNLHASLAIQALNHGKSVFLEKPAAMNDQELEALLSAARSSKQLLMVGHNRRFSPFVEQIKLAMRERSGPLVITYRMNAGYVPPEAWVHGPEGGGRIIGECCHVFDLFNFLIGSFPQELAALALAPSSAQILATDNFTTTIRYGDGSLCTLTYTSLGSSDVPKEMMEVHFDGKSFILDDYRRVTFHGSSQKPKTGLLQDKGHLAEMRSLSAYLRGKGSIPMTLEEIESAAKTSFAVDNLVRSGTGICAGS